MSYVRRSRNKFTGIANDKDEVLPCYAETELDVLKRAVIMNEIINSILEAEQKASEIVAKAGKRANSLQSKAKKTPKKKGKTPFPRFRKNVKKRLQRRNKRQKPLTAKF